MAISPNPVYKIELSKRSTITTFVDVTTALIKDSTLDMTSGSRISGGTMLFDRDEILTLFPDIDSQDEIKVSIGDDTADLHLFTGVLEEDQDDDAPDTIVFSVKSYAILTTRRKATEVYRKDAGNGDPVDIVKDLIDKYLPELNYDSTSIPDKPVDIEDFLNYRLQNTTLKGVFDFIAGKILNRVWYVDKNKKFFMVTKVFAATSLVLTTGDNIIGNLEIATDIKRWANYVMVNGKVFAVGFKDTYEGNSANRKFTLSYRPNDLAVTVDDVPKVGALKDSEFSAEADYIIDQEGESFEFTVAETPGSGTEVIASYTFYDKVHDEAQDAASILAYGISAKEITNEDIDTLTKATTIMNNHLAIYASPLKIYGGLTFWDEDLQPLNKCRLVDVDRGVDKDLNIIETNFRFGDNSFDVKFRLNDFNFGIVDLYEDLLNRVIRLERRFSDSSQQIAKFIFFGADFAVSLDNLHIGSEGVCNALALDHTNGTLDDGSFYLDGCNGGGSLLDEGEVRVVNLNNVFTEAFYVDFYKGSAGGSHGGPNWNTTTKRLEMNAGTNKSLSYTTFQDFNVFHKTGNNVATIKPICTENKWGSDKVQYMFRIDGGAWEGPVDNNETLTVAATGEAVEGRVLFQGNGANETYVDEFQIEVTEV